MAGRRGIHTKPNNGQTVEWITPPEINQALGPFDLDPCSHPKQFYRTAARMICPPADGLAEKWEGRVWLNPPYGSDLKNWIARLSETRRGIGLVPSRTDVEEWFWPFIWERAEGILFVRGRICFLQPDGTRIRMTPSGPKKTGNAGHASVLVAYSDFDVEKLLKQTVLRGVLIDPRKGSVIQCPQP